MDAEPRGIRGLRKVAAQFTSHAAPTRRTGTVRRWRAKTDGTRIDAADVLEPAVRLALVGGKGGVGKTTTAAAMALSAAARWPERRVLLISTDPAHSLADVLGWDLSDRAQSLADAPSNLRVRELDAPAVIARIRARYTEAIDQVFDRLGGGGNFDAAHDRSVMQSLIDLAPPGLDELASVLEITDAITGAAPQWDLVVMDTAPTGHALRLLEMPGLMQDWVRALMSILLKYQGVARLGDLGALLLELSKGLGRLRELLADGRQTAFVAVTRPAALPRLETARLVRRLKRLHIPVTAVVVSAIGRGTCQRCVSVRRAQEREIAAMRASARTAKIPRVVLTEARVRRPAVWRLSRNGPAPAGASLRNRCDIIEERDRHLPVLHRQVGNQAVHRTVPRGVTRCPTGAGGSRRRITVADCCAGPATYGPEHLERGLSDMDWVGSVALAHESVVEHFARRADATVIPMKLFTMFTSVERAVADIAARKAAIAAAMRRIAGAEEWGVRILRAPAAPRPNTPASRAASGAAFLAARKKARDEAKLSRLAAAEAAADVFDELVTIARDARRRDDAPAAGATPPLLDAAFLVPATSRSRFKSAATRAAARCAGTGAQMTVSGPWPAYNFVQIEEQR